MRTNLVTAHIERLRGHRDQCQSHSEPFEATRIQCQKGVTSRPPKQCQRTASWDSGPLWDPGYTQTSLSQYHFVKGDTPHHKDGIHTGF